MKRLLHLLILLGLMAGFISLSGCLRDDDEPQIPVRPISRLYVSTSEYQTNTDLDPFQNIYIYGAADGESFGAPVFRFNSGARGGNRILFSPEIRRVFQSSVNNASYIDTAIRTLQINEETGQLATGGNQGNPPRIEHGLLNSVRSFAYHSLSGQMFIINSTEAGSNLYAYLTPANRSNPVPPNFIVPLNGISGARQIFMRDLSNRREEHNNITYVTRIASGQQTAGIVGYRGLTGKLIGDTLVNNVVPDFTLSVVGAENMVGAAYSPTLDLLVVTDYSSSGTNPAGRLLFFENFSQHPLTETHDLTPSRMIEGSNTLLNSPRDVQIDTRENASYLYVADVGDRSVLRFRIDDEGNVAPNARLVIEGRTPMGISLDARGTILVEEE